MTLEKTCEFKDIEQEDLLISKVITIITDKKLWEKLICEKTFNLKTTVELITRQLRPPTPTIYHTTRIGERQRD